MKTIINYTKNNIKYLIIGTIILCIVMCSPIILSVIRKNKIETVVNEYINTIKLGNYDESLKYLDEEYDYSNNALLIYYDELIEFYSKFTIDIENVKVKDKYAIVELKINTPSTFYLLDQNFKLQIENKTYDINYYKSILNSRTLEYEEGKVQISLRKIDGKWKIINNEFLKIFLDYGSSDNEINFEYLVENENKKKEIQEYIKKYIKITDYEVKLNNIGELSLHDIEIKNNGNKDISRLDIEVTISNKNISRTITLIDITDKELKSNDNWKSYDLEYYNIDRMSKKTLTLDDKNNITIRVKNISFKN